jgi:uncharacterized protein YukE
MAERGLVVRQDSLSEMEQALTTATSEITKQISELLARVNTVTPGWEPTSDSHEAHAKYQQRLTDGITALTDALEKVRTTMADYREEARSTEVENVAIVG